MRKQKGSLERHKWANKEQDDRQAGNMNVPKKECGAEIIMQSHRVRI